MRGAMASMLMSSTLWLSRRYCICITVTSRKFSSYNTKTHEVNECTTLPPRQRLARWPFEYLVDCHLIKLLGLLEWCREELGEALNETLGDDNVESLHCHRHASVDRLFVNVHRWR